MTLYLVERVKPDGTSLKVREFVWCAGDGSVSTTPQTFAACAYHEIEKARYVQDDAFHADGRRYEIVEVDVPEVKP